MFVQTVLRMYNNSMLPKEYRLKKKTAFNATYKRQNSFYKNGIVMFCGRPIQSDAKVKIGFVVSKKTHKRAVKRNRLKRLMRESIRLIIKDGYNLNTVQSIIFVGKSQALDKNFKEIDSSIKALIKEIPNANA